MKVGDKVVVTEELLNYGCKGSRCYSDIGLKGRVINIDYFGQDFVAVALDAEMPDPLQPNKTLTYLTVLPVKALALI